MRKIYYTFQLLICFLISPLSFAVDGVLEINQTCATQLGCFSGDSAGFPVTIANEGSSYRLTSNLVIPSLFSSAILISTSNINIDLNGFSIIGSGCLGQTTNCRPTFSRGYAAGIRAITSSSVFSISNGNIIGMGASGISLLNFNVTIQNITAKWNGGIGLIIGSNGKILNSSAIENGFSGIESSSNSRIYGNISIGNLSDGIVAESNSSIINNIVTDNTGFGLKLTSFVAYKDNVLNNNTDGNVNSSGVNMGGNL